PLSLHDALPIYYRAERSEEQEDHNHHDEQRIDQRFYDFVDRVVDVSCRVIRDLPGHASRQFLLNLLHFRANAFDYVHRVRIWQHPYAHEHRFLPRKANFGIVIFGTEDDVRNIAEPDEIPFIFTHDEFLKVVRRL